MPARQGQVEGESSPRTLLDPQMERDSCGVGFVASALGKPSHRILEQALTALARLAHRGAVAVDGKSSDGVGVMTGIPKKLLVEATGFEVGEDAELGVGMMFIPRGEMRAESVMESCIASQGLRVLGWRDVPINIDVLGEISLSTMPKIRQVLVVDGKGSGSRAQGSEGEDSFDSMDRRLYLARKQFERALELDEVTGYACSLSSRTIVYKSLCLGCHLAEFYPDLASPEYVTNFHNLSSALCDEHIADMASGAAGAEAGT